MNSLLKVLVSIGMILGFVIFFGMIVIKSKSSESTTPMLFAAIFFFGLVAGLKAVWKKKKASHTSIDKKN